MYKKTVLVFGNNEYGQKIYRSVEQKCNEVVLYGLEEKLDKESLARPFDLSDDWSELSDNYDMDDTIVFCALQEEDKNIFLTISLHTIFPHTNIIALAKNKEDLNKLHMAGASKVIPIVETTALILADMIKKPIITEVLHNLLYEDGSLKLMQVQVHNAEYFQGQYPADINWSRDHGVLVLSILNQDGTSEFIYSAKAKHREVHNGDTFIVIGYEEDIKSFKNFIGEVNE